MPFEADTCPCLALLRGAVATLLLLLLLLLLLFLLSCGLEDPLALSSSTLLPLALLLSLPPAAFLWLTMLRMPPSTDTQRSGGIDCRCPPFILPLSTLLLFRRLPPALWLLLIVHSPQLRVVPIFARPAARVLLLRHCCRGGVRLLTIPAVGFALSPTSPPLPLFLPAELSPSVGGILLGHLGGRDGGCEPFLPIVRGVAMPPTVRGVSMLAEGTVSGFLADNGGVDNEVDSGVDGFGRGTLCGGVGNGGVVVAEDPRLKISDCSR